MENDKPVRRCWNCTLPRSYSGHVSYRDLFMASNLGGPHHGTDHGHSPFIDILDERPNLRGRAKSVLDHVLYYK